MSLLRGHRHPHGRAHLPRGAGGDDVVKDCTRKKCNESFSHDFEAKFNNAMKFFCFLFKIGNRQGIVPMMEATAMWQGAELRVLLNHHGKVRPLGRRPVEVVGEDGRKQYEYLFPSLKEKKKFDLDMASPLVVM
jgi:hypothetical protein